MTSKRSSVWLTLSNTHTIAKEYTSGVLLDAKHKQNHASNSAGGKPPSTSNVLRWVVGVTHPA